MSTRAWIARDDTRRARGELNVLKQLAPGVAGVHALDGSLQLILGNPAAARVAFERALQLDADAFEALNGLTAIDVLEGRTELARARIETIMRANDRDPDLLFLAAKVFIASGDRNQATTMLRRAIELDPLGMDSYILLGRLYAEAGRLDAARAEFTELERSDPSSLPAKLMAALIAHAEGRLDDAILRYREVLRLEPRAALAANNVAALYVDRNEHLDLAQQFAEAAAEQFPAHAGVQDTLGRVYYHRHMLGQAVFRFERSVEAAPDNAVYHYHLGLAYSKNGETDRARAALRRALTLDPHFADARQALAALDATGAS